MTTPEPKERKSLTVAGGITKSAKLSPWLRRLKPEQSGVPLPETKTVPKMSTSAPKEQKSLAIGGQVTKSAKKSTWNLFSKENVEKVQKVTNTAPFCGGQTRTPEPKERKLLAVAGGVTKRAQISTSKGRPTPAHSGMLVPETNTVSRMSTPQPKDQKSPAITGRFTKSAQKSTWKGRPMPAYSGILLPETNSVPKI